MNWRSNKKFSIAFLQANVNFQKKEQINRQKSKKEKPKKKKKWNPNIPKTKKKKSKKIPKRNLCERS